MNNKAVVPVYALEKAKNSLLETTGLPPQLPKQDWGDLSVPCFSKQNPAEEAKKLAEKPPSPYFSEAKAEGPFVNYFFSPAFYSQVLKESLSPKYGSAKRKNSRPIVLEYSQPNPGKPMHLGHIRSTIIGDVCARLLKFNGFARTKRLNYLNDRGAHIAELITALKEFKDMPEVKDEKDLVAYYVKIKGEIDGHPELKEKSRKVLENLRKYKKELEKIREMSWAAFQRNYSLLGVEFDAVPLETSLEKNALAAVKECLGKNLARVEPDGAIIALLEPELPNTVLLRSNKTPLYFTSDIALADWKWKKYKFSESCVFTASEQNLHFRQLQLLLKKLGREYAEKYNHRGFGLIRLEEGKMSTREGRVLLLEDVLSEAIWEAKKQVLAKQQATEVDETAKALGIGALKFGVLRITMAKDITFSATREVQFEGDTSAYVQYAHVRCCSILEKAGTDAKTAKPKKLQLNDAEKALLKTLALFPLAVQSSAEKLEPHRLCDYALALGHAFTKFYDQSPVLTAGTPGLKNQRLAMVKATKNVLALTLTLLGIKALERM